MTRVLVTGAMGLLGCSLGAALESHGWDVIRHGRHRGDVIGDLTDARIASGIVAQSHAECVVNLAALTDVDRCEVHPREAYALNTRVVENLVEAIRRLSNAPHLIQISTDQIYDGPGPHGEDDVTLTNYYGFSKYAGELAAKGVSSTVLRTNFFGRSRCSNRNSFSDWIVGALNRGESVQVFEDVYFSPLSLDRLAYFIALAVDRRVAGVFNLGSRQGMSKADFCYALADSLNLATATMSRAKSSERVLRAYRPKDMRMDCERFETAHGVVLPTLQQEIESMKRYYDVAS
jgi:dTDP-4-dehydrorhamnose reductase